MSKGIKKIQCPSCGGPNTSIEDTTSLECAFCGMAFSIAEVEDNSTEIKPKDEKVFNCMVMAETALEGEDYEEAISYFNKVLEIDSSHAASWFGKGTSIIYTSTLGDIKMKEALSYYKNAIKFSKGKKMKEDVANELLSTVQVMYPNIEAFYGQYKSIDNSLNESGADSFLANCAKFMEGLQFALECDPENLEVIDYALDMPVKYDKALRFTSLYKGRLNAFIGEFIDAKSKVDPVYAKAVEGVMENPKVNEQNRNATVQSATGKKSGCFIATATMGDFNHPVVMQLREFRDQYLLERNWGKKFTRYYYKWGPYPAKIISKSNLLKKISYVFIVQPLSFVVQKIMNKEK